MSVVKENDQITISYTGKLDNGTVFTTVTDKQPQTIVVGNHDVPPTVEKALIGLAPGQSVKVRVEPDEGYGPRRKDLLHTLSQKTFSAKIEPKVGMILSLNIDKDGEDHQVPATVVEVKGDLITVDYNHPLAGHNLTYELTVLSIG
ncbi:MAG: peptidylprolyl isomerase [Thermodesulfobacteriota bacterium]